MKIQIIQLEAHDDTISTRDKMGWGQTSRILLVWPPKGRILTRTLDLVLLQRHGAAIGAQLALVTRDEDVCFNAQQLGISTYPTLRQAQSPRRSGEVSRRRLLRRKRLRLRKLKPLSELLARREQVRPLMIPWSAIPAVQLVAFAVAVLAFLVLLAVLVPGVSISITPRQETRAVSIPIIASPDYDTPRLTGELPARWVSVIVEARATQPTTGKVMVPEKPSIGGVVFTNLTDQPIDIPAGTIVRTQDTPPLRFATTQPAKIVAGPSTSLTIPVQALSPGSAGNVAARSIQSIEGPLGLLLSAENRSALHGGSDRPAAGPSALDRTQLYDKLSQDLPQTARQELSSPSSSSLRPGDLAILSSLKFSQVVEERYLPEDNEPADQLELTLRLEYLALVISGQDLQTIAAPFLKADIPNGYSAIPGSLQIEPVGSPVMTGVESARWQIKASQVVQADIAPESVAAVARGLPAAQAADRLYDSLPLDSEPEVRLFPSWWPYLPLVPLRIEVN